MVTVELSIRELARSCVRTETLLRLLLPLSDKVHETFQHNVQKLSTASVRITQSVGATGGVPCGQ